MSNNAIYLKINRSEAFALQNISRWIDVAILMGEDCFILCDDDKTKKMILDNLVLSQKCFFIESNKGDVSKKIITNIANRNWENAGYAHLTTFIHSAEAGYDYFWNIDADDTMICLSVNRIVEMMRLIENNVMTNGIDIISLDMWRTKWKGKHWSFGIAFGKSSPEWITEMESHCEDEIYKKHPLGMNYNIDCFFTYLKDITDLSIETFYFENMKFIHYSNDFFKGLISSAFYHWKEGMLEYPIMKWCIGLDELSKFEIYEDVIRFDIGIDDAEATNLLTYYSRDGHEFRGLVDWTNIVNQSLFVEKRKQYMTHMDDRVDVICFGAGSCLDNNIDKFKSVCNLKYICDNDSLKWGKLYYDDIVCISPEELASMENIMVIIAVYSPKIRADIENQLCKLGIKNYDSYENFLKCVE